MAATGVGAALAARNQALVKLLGDVIQNTNVVGT